MGRMRVLSQNVGSINAGGVGGLVMPGRDGGRVRNIVGGMVAAAGGLAYGKYLLHTDLGLGALLLGALGYYAHRCYHQGKEITRTEAALKAAAAHVTSLEGLLPICTSCKRVCDETGYWSQIDTYLHDRANALFSHGYCPECAAKAFEDLGVDVPARVLADLAARNFE